MICVPVQKMIIDYSNSFDSFVQNHYAVLTRMHFKTFELTHVIRGATAPETDHPPARKPRRRRTGVCHSAQLHAVDPCADGAALYGQANAVPCVGEAREGTVQLWGMRMQMCVGIYLGDSFRCAWGFTWEAHAPTLTWEHQH